MSREGMKQSVAWYEQCGGKGPCFLCPWPGCKYGTSTLFANMQDHAKKCSFLPASVDPDALDAAYIMGDDIAGQMSAGRVRGKKRGRSPSPLKSAPAGKAPRDGRAAPPPPKAAPEIKAGLAKAQKEAAKLAAKEAVAQAKAAAAAEAAQIKAAAAMEAEKEKAAKKDMAEKERADKKLAAAALKGRKAAERKAETAAANRFGMGEGDLGLLATYAAGARGSSASEVPMGTLAQFVPAQAGAAAAAAPTGGGRIPFSLIPRAWGGGGAARESAALFTPSPVGAAAGGAQPQPAFAASSSSTSTSAYHTATTARAVAPSPAMAIVLPPMIDRTMGLNGLVLVLKAVIASGAPFVTKPQKAAWVSAATFLPVSAAERDAQVTTYFSSPANRLLRNEISAAARTALSSATLPDDFMALQPWQRALAFCASALGVSTSMALGSTASASSSSGVAVAPLPPEIVDSVLVAVAQNDELAPRFTGGWTSPIYHNRVATYVLVCLFACLTDTTQVFETSTLDDDITITQERRLWNMTNTVSWTTGPDPMLASIHADFPTLLRALPPTAGLPLGGDFDNVRAGTFINALASRLSLAYCESVMMRAARAVGGGGGGGASSSAAALAVGGAGGGGASSTVAAHSGVFCTRCGRQFGRDERFCPSDGYPRALPQVPVAAAPAQAVSAASASGAASLAAAAVEV